MHRHDRQNVLKGGVLNTSSNEITLTVRSVQYAGCMLQKSAIFMFFSTHWQLPTLAQQIPRDTNVILHLAHKLRQLLETTVRILTQR